MLKVFSLKNQKKEDNGTSGTSSTTSPSSNANQQASLNSQSKRSSAAQLRITKDMNELTLPNTCQLEFPDKDDLLNFKLVVSPDEVGSN